MQLYFFKDGYLRTSSDDYTLKVKNNNYVHLTNNCLQKYGNSYGKHEDGNTLSFDDFQAYLDEILPDLGINVEEHFVARIKDLVIDTFLSVKDEINPRKRKHCFEVFGYDFMIDEDMRTWLIEVSLYNKSSINA